MAACAGAEAGPGRPSHEGRGLKFAAVLELRQNVLRSSLSRGTWIEMFLSWFQPSGSSSSLSRGTWIEINSIKTRHARCGAVVPLTRDVD